MPTGRDFELEADLIAREGLAPVANRALIGHRTSRSTSEQPYLRAFRRLDLLAQMRTMAADAGGRRVFAELNSAGIPTAIVKGPSMARFHPDGWPRPYADIDVLVSTRNYLQAIALAESVGFTHSDRSVPQWKWFDLVCREGINLHSLPGGNIDFHHHLPPWAVGSGTNVEDVIRRSEPNRLCAASVKYALPEDQILVAALHVLNDLWKGKMGLASWRDFIILDKLLGTVASRKAFVGAKLGWLYDLMCSELNVRVPEAEIRPVSPSFELPTGQRLRIAALGWSNDSMATRHRLAWITRLPMLNAIAYLAGTAIPSPEYIHSRHGSLRNYWKRGLHETILTAHGSDYRMTTVDDYEPKENGPSARG
jgi:hypothetical protein